jgi:hypothetical protein
MGVWTQPLAPQVSVVHWSVSEQSVPETNTHWPLKHVVFVQASPSSHAVLSSFGAYWHAVPFGHVAVSGFSQTPGGSHPTAQQAPPTQWPFAH